jgi:hypothetical protein
MTGSKKRGVWRPFAIAAIAAVWLATMVTAPVSAELADQPTTSWGVQGLGTGTNTDTIKSEVFAIEQIGNRIFVGGRFLETTDGNETINQPYLAAFDATSGVYISSFAPQLDNAVFALEAAPDGSKLFVAGTFDQVNGVPTGGLVALNPNTGNLDSWSGRIGGYNLVRNLDLVGNDLYVSGSFGSISSNAGSNAAWGTARFNWQTGNHDSSWRPVISGGSVWGIAASEVNDRVYIAGAFDTVNGQNRPGGFAALNASDDELAGGVLPFQVNTQNVSRQYL